MKTIPIALQTHYEQEATSWCFLARIECKNGTVVGLTTLDADLTYDDGRGAVTYLAANGLGMHAIQATADLSIDNSDLKFWVSDSGITEAQIRAGLFDYAKVDIYRVNYLDLAAGHEKVSRGTLGETRYSRLAGRAEFRSLKQQLRQTISLLYSLTCRAKFGSKPIGTGGEQPEERKPCHKDWVWVTGTVTAVDANEPDRIFTDASRAEATGHFVPGVVQILDGDNAGAEMDVDVFEGGVFTLALPLPYPLPVGTNYRARQDCDKTFKMCKERHGNTPWFRGEHLIPIADGGSNQVPGAQIPRSGGTGGGAQA